MQKSYEPVTETKSSFAEASVVSQLLFLWLQPLISLGSRRPLEEPDLPLLPRSDLCQQLAAHDDGVDDSFVQQLWRMTKSHYAKAMLSLACSFACTSVQPILVHRLLDFLSNKDHSSSDGLLLVLLLFVSSCLAVLTLEHGFYRLTYGAINARSLTMDLIYRKALNLPSNLTNRGEIVTLMSVDAQRIFECCRLSPWVLIGLVLFGLAHVLIGFFFDPLTSLIGFILLGGLVGLSFCFTNRIARARTDLVKVTQQRVRLTTEIIEAVRLVKLLAWEDVMTQQIETIRQQEMKLLRRMHLWKVLNKAFLFLTPLILSGTMLSVYIYLGNSINTAKAFTLLACMNVSKLAFTLFPQAVAMFYEAQVSINRINTYLQYGEVHQSNVQPKKTPIIRLTNCSFTFHAPPPLSICSTDSFKLKNINLEIEAGSLTIIVGGVGSGKSSLVLSMLREMDKIDGEMEIEGSFSFAGQEPWLRNTTIRDNILLEDTITNEDWYETVLDLCHLRPDLKKFPAGDQSEIGEQGINLSGGQKARISLARAFYARKDFLLLDDVLSAVDAHVANDIFHKGIKYLAEHMNVTTVLVMNSHYQFLPEASRILVMSDGEIIGDGKFEQLKDQHEFLCTTAVQEEVTDDNTATLSKLDDIVDDDGDQDKMKHLLIVKEDRKKGRIAFHTYLSYFQLSGLNGGVAFFLLFTLYGCGQAFRTLTDLWHGQWSDHEQKHPGEHTLHDGLYFALLILLSIVFVVMSVVVFIFLGLRCTHQLHNLAFRKILAAPVSTFFDVIPLGRLLNRLSVDIDSVDSRLQDFGAQSFQEYFQVFAILIVCIIASWHILFAYVPIFMIFYRIGKYFLVSSTEIKRLDNLTKSPVFSSFTSTLNGVQIIRAFQLQDQFLHINRAAVDKNSSFFFTFLCSGYWLAIRLDFLSVLMITIVSTLLVLTKGSIDSSVAGLTLVSSLSITSLLQWCVRLWNLTESSMTSVERLQHFKSIQSEEISPTKLPSIIRNWPNKGNIEFQGLSLRYRPDLKLALKGISVSICGGQKIGICGRTGAGKSSLMVALFRLSEFDQGTILIDGVDISNISLKQLRQSLSVIPQDPVLFSGSLRYNLDPYHTATDDALENALRRVYLWEFVSGDLDFNVAERGGNLSLGQRQLVCIARAILRKNQIIVMDEATASVDIATDSLLQTTIREAFDQQTILTIAHRLETILESDKILLLDDGCVAEFGEPKALLEKPNGLFRALARDANAL